MLSAFKKIFDLFINNDRKRVAIIFTMVVVTGFLDMIGIASIVPFVMILSNENLIESNTYLSAVYYTLSFENTDDFGFVYIQHRNLSLFSFLCNHRFSNISWFMQIYFLAIGNKMPAMV